MFEAVLDWLKWEERDDLFANFPIGVTIQDGGKRKRSTANNNDDEDQYRHHDEKIKINVIKSEV